MILDLKGQRVKATELENWNWSAWVSRLRAICCIERTYLQALTDGRIDILGGHTEEEEGEE